MRLSCCYASNTDNNKHNGGHSIMQRAPDRYDEQTDTHLAKRYNDILSDCISGCNQAGMAMDSLPHIQNLQVFYGAVHTLYKNCFMLFYDQPSPSKKYNSLTDELIQRMRLIEQGIKLMRRRQEYRNSRLFEFIKVECDVIQMLIMDGLQRRKMLVRMSEREPTGEATIPFWQDKAAFRQGGKLGI